jgi:hypothetical protein
MSGESKGLPERRLTFEAQMSAVEGPAGAGYGIVNRSSPPVV